MMLLTDINDEALIIALEDGTEIEIEIIELEGNQSKVLVTTDESVDVIRIFLSNR